MLQHFSSFLLNYELRNKWGTNKQNKLNELKITIYTDTIMCVNLIKVQISKLQSFVQIS